MHLSDTVSDAAHLPSPVLVVSQQYAERDVPLDEIIVHSNLKRSINQDRVAALKGSMAEIGLFAPIVVTQDNVLVTGNHRLVAARQLGWKKIRARIVPSDALLNELVAIDENLMRAELSILEQSEQLHRREEIIRELHTRAVSGENQFTTTSGEYVVAGITESGGLYSRPPRSTSGKVTTKELAASSGLAKSTYQERMKIVREIPEDVRDLIRENPLFDNKSELLRLAKVKDPVEQMKIAQTVVNGDVKTVKESVTKSEREKTRAQYVRTAEGFDKLPDGITLVKGDFFEYEESIPDDLVDMILTDPPYVSDWAENITPFMTIANRILKPGGVLVMYLGHIRLPDYFHGLDECVSVFKENALQFYWECALEHSGARAVVHPVGVMVGFKPILIAMKPPIHRPNKMYTDLLPGSGRDKDAHDWQQSPEEIIPLIQSFSRPGDTVLDPFCGSGSTGIAARMHARKFVGIDIDGENVKVARGRLLQVIVEK
jgi:site-specific DNA-methyltransferase (adenine-specific)